MSGVATVIGNWWRDFGDNDAVGWAITVAYFLVAALCFRAAGAARRNAVSADDLRTPGELAPSAHARSRPRDWAIIGTGILLLGLNKQLDLQILARDTGIALVRALGFDAQRRWVGRLMFLCLSAAVLVVLARSAAHLRRARRGHNLTLAGLALLACFLIVRAAGYQPYLRDLNLRFKDVLHLVFELGGLVLVGLSAWRGATGANGARPSGTIPSD